MRARIAPLLLACAAFGAERGVDPTFLHRYLPGVRETAVEISSPTCHYKPLFGASDPNSGIVKGVARYGEITVDAGGSCKSAAFPGEEQAYFIAGGTGAIQYGEEKSAVRSGDFFFVPPKQPHALFCAAGAECRAIVMGFKVPPAGAAVQAPAKLDVANIDAVKKQVVGNHPPSTLYQLMIGDAKSTRDRIAAGQVLTSLFIMEFTPGGTNFPHHHDTEEEVYLVLDGEGDMVAGGGIDGIEGRHKAKPGDAYFFRLNCTVGFYNSDAPGTKKARILAVRSLYPRRK